MKDKKKSVIKFEPSSKMPVLFYAITAVILSCFFMIISLLTSGFSFTMGKGLSLGDLNNDGNFSASDALYIMMRDENKVDFSGAQIDASDVNKDGLINSLDATLIIQYASKTSDKLGTLAVGNTKMEKPSSKKAAETDNSDETAAVNNQNIVLSGNSYSAAFCTSESDVYTTAKITNKWQSNGKYYYQVEIVLKNNSGQYIGDSSVELDFSSDVTVEKSWDCSVTDSDYGLNVTTQCNAYIPDGGLLKCGMVVSSPIAVEIESISK